MKKALSLKVILILAIFVLVIGCLSGIVFAENEFELVNLDISAYVGKAIKGIYFPVGYDLDENLLGRNIKSDENGDYIKALTFNISPGDIECEMRLYVRGLCGVSLNYPNGDFENYLLLSNGFENIHLSLSDYALSIGCDENAFVLTSYTDKFREVLSSHLTSYIELFSEDFLVSFDVVLGNSVIENQTVAYGEYAEAPEAPVAEGYTFKGWSPDIQTTAITQNTTFTAQWQINTYTVIFDLNGGEHIGGGELVQTVVHGKNPVFPEVKKFGYYLYSWSGGAYGGITSDRTLIAVWYEKYYTVEFKTTNGTWVSGQTSQQIQEGQAARAPVLTRKGYSLSWDKSFDNVTSNLIVNPIWTPIQIVVTFDLNGGERVGGGELEQVGIYNETDLYAPEVIRVGYTFNGWSPNKPAFFPLENTTYVAQWEINTYIVKFYDYNHSLIEEQNIEYGQNPAELSKSVIITGNVFKHWLVSDGSIISDYKGYESYIVTDDVVFNMVVVEHLVTITFDLNGCTQVGGGELVQIVQYVDEIVLPEVSEDIFLKDLNYYKFSNWVNLPETDLDLIDKENITVTAGLTLVLSHVVTFETDGGSLIENQIVAHGDKAQTPVNPIKEGYTFNGWSPDISTTAITQNTTFTAQWQRNSYTVNFDTDGGSRIEAQTVFYGDYAVVPANPTKEGYTFKGWSPRIETTVIIGHNVVFTALWEINTYTVTFDLNGGNYDGDIALVQSVEYLGFAQLPENPTKEGYTFKGWDNELESNQIRGDTTFVAQWEIIKYVVKFYDGNGNVNQQFVAHGDLAVLPENPEKDGFVFMNWSPDVLIPITRDTLFKAVWGKEITFVVVSSGLAEYWKVPELVETVIVEVNTVLNYVSSFEVPQNHEFYCWCTYENLDIIFDDDIELGTYDEYFLKDFVVTENMTVYALYKQRTYTVTFNYNGGDWVGSTDRSSYISNGQVFTYPYEGYEDLMFIVFGKGGGGRISGDKSFLASFYREGYYVCGWSYDLSYKPYCENIVLYPLWDIAYSITFDFGEYTLTDYSIISELPYDLFDGAVWSLPQGYVFEKRLVEKLLNSFEYDGGLYLGLKKPDGFYINKKCEIGDLYDLTEPLNSSVILYVGNHADVGLWEALKLFFTDFDMFKSEVGLIMRLAVYSIVVAVILLVFYIIFALFKALFSSKRRH